MSKMLKRSIKGFSAIVGESSASAKEVFTPAEFKYESSFHPSRHLTLSEFSGKTFIHIREFTSLDGKLFPTKKGVSLTPGRLSILRGKIEEINSALGQQEVNAIYDITVGSDLFKAHIGGGIYVTVSEKFRGVNLRRYWIPEGAEEIVPTRNGIYLPASQWSALIKKLDELLAVHPELLHAEGCIFSHQNQMGYIDCGECQPFGMLT